MRASNFGLLGLEEDTVLLTDCTYKSKTIYKAKLIGGYTCGNLHLVQGSIPIHYLEDYFGNINFVQLSGDTI